MGHASSKLSQAISLFKYSPNYNIIKKFDDPHYGPIKLIEDRETQRRMFLKEITFTDEKAYSEEYDFFSRRASVSHPHIVHIIGFNTQKGQKFCSKFFKILIFIETPGKNLQQELKERIQADKPFNEAALLLIAQNLISALAYLQTLNLSHGDIRPFNICNYHYDYKLFDPSLVPERELSGLAKAILHIQKSYLSPGLIEQVPRNELTSICNKFKDDVFSLGITLLSLASLSYGEDLYNYELGLIAKGLLENRLEVVKKRYSPLVYDLIKLMLAVNEKDRPDFQQLQSRLLPYQEAIRQDKATLIAESPTNRSNLHGEYDWSIGATPEKFRGQGTERGRSSDKKSNEKNYSPENISSFSERKQNMKVSMDDFLQTLPPVSKSERKSGRLKIFDDNDKENTSTNIVSKEEDLEFKGLSKMSPFEQERESRRGWDKESQEGLQFDYGGQRPSERGMDLDFPNPFEEESLQGGVNEMSQERLPSQRDFYKGGDAEMLGMREQNQEEFEREERDLMEKEDKKWSKRDDYNYTLTTPQNTMVEPQNQEEGQWTTSQGDNETDFPTFKEEKKKTGGILIDSENVDPSRRSELYKDIKDAYEFALLSPSQQESRIEQVKRQNEDQKMISQGVYESERTKEENQNKPGGIIIEPENVIPERMSEIQMDPTHKFYYSMFNKKQEMPSNLQKQEGEKMGTAQGYLETDRENLRKDLQKPGSIIIEQENVDPSIRSEIHWDPSHQYQYAKLGQGEMGQEQEKDFGLGSEKIIKQEEQEKSSGRQDEGKWTSSHGFYESEPSKKKERHTHPGGIIIEPEDARLDSQSEVLEDPTHRFHFAMLKDLYHQNKDEQKSVDLLQTENQQDEPEKKNILLPTKDQRNQSEFANPGEQQEQSEMTKEIGKMVAREFNYEFNRSIEQEPIKRIDDVEPSGSQNRRFGQSVQEEQNLGQKTFKESDYQIPLETRRPPEQEPMKMAQKKSSETEQNKEESLMSLNLPSFISNSEGGMVVGSDWVDFNEESSPPQKQSEEHSRTGGIIIQLEDAIASKRAELMRDPNNKYSYAMLRPQNGKSNEQPDLMNVVLQDSSVPNEPTKKSYQSNVSLREGNYEKTKPAEKEQIKDFQDMISSKKGEIQNQGPIACEKSQPITQQKPESLVEDFREEKQGPWSGLREYYLEYNRPNEVEPIKRDDSEIIQQAPNVEKFQAKETRHRIFPEKQSPSENLDYGQKLSKSHVLGTEGSLQERDLVNRVKDSPQQANTIMNLSHDPRTLGETTRTPTRRKEIEEMNALIEKALLRSKKTFDEVKGSLGDINQENANPNLDRPSERSGKNDNFDLMNDSIHTAISYYAPATPKSNIVNNLLDEGQNIGQSDQTQTQLQQGAFPQMSI